MGPCNFFFLWDKNICVDSLEILNILHGPIHLTVVIAINSKSYSQTADHAAPLHTWKATTTDVDGPQGYLVLWSIVKPLSSAQAFFFGISIQSYHCHKVLLSHLKYYHYLRPQSTQQIVHKLTY